MDEQTNTERRGSERMFDMDMRDPEALAKAIGAGRGDYEVKWWWKFGQPGFIDHVRGGLHVRPERIGQTLQEVLQNNSERVQVSAKVFPYGITNPDLFQVEVEMRRSPGGR